MASMGIHGFRNPPNSTDKLPDHGQPCSNSIKFRGDVFRKVSLLSQFVWNRHFLKQNIVLFLFLSWSIDRPRWTMVVMLSKNVETLSSSWYNDTMLLDTIFPGTMLDNPDAMLPDQIRRGRPPQEFLELVLKKDLMCILCTICIYVWYICIICVLRILCCWLTIYLFVCFSFVFVFRFSMSLEPTLQV